MNVEALHRLACLLERSGPYARLDPIAPEAFNLENWTCGTASCAVGHAMADPWFKERGLRGKRISDLPVLIAPYVGPHTLNGWPAVEKFFGLDGATAALLFSDREYPKDVDPCEVAARIRLVIRLAGYPTPSEYE